MFFPHARIGWQGVDDKSGLTVDIIFGAGYKNIISSRDEDGITLYQGTDHCHKEYGLGNASCLGLMADIKLGYTFKMVKRNRRSEPKSDTETITPNLPKS